MRVAAVATLCLLAGCLEAPPGSGSGRDGGPGDGDGGPGDACGTLNALRDELDSSEIDASLWGAIGGVAASAEAIEIATSPGAGFASLSSTAYYRVAGQVEAVVDVSGLADATLVMELDSGDHQAGIHLEDDQVWLQIADATGTRMLGSGPFDPFDVYWRLSAGDGEFSFATSPNGDTWTERGPFAGDIGSIAHVDFELMPDSQATTVIIESVNSGEAGVHCPAASFTDDFATQSRRWQVDQQGTCVITVAGQAELSYAAQAFCAMTTRERFDLTGSSWAVEMVEVGDCLPQPIMLVVPAGGEQLSIHCRDDGGMRTLVAWAMPEPGELSAIDYVAGDQRFVRLRHDVLSDGLIFEHSPDGAVDTWTTFASVPSPGGLERTSLRFYLGGPTTEDAPESVAFDNLNLPGAVSGARRPAAAIPRERRRH